MRKKTWLFVCGENIRAEEDRILERIDQQRLRERLWCEALAAAAATPGLRLRLDTVRARRKATT